MSDANPVDDALEARIQLVALDYFRQEAIGKAEEILQLLSEPEFHDLAEFLNLLAADMQKKDDDVLEAREEAQEWRRRFLSTYFFNTNEKQADQWVKEKLPWQN